MASLFWTRLLIRAGVARFLPWVRRDLEDGANFLNYYSDRLLAGPHADLRHLAGFLETPDEPDRIDLTLGAPQFDLVPSASTKLPAGRRGFPPSWGLPELRSLIAAKLEADQQLHLNPADEVLVTQGVAGAWSAVLDAFVNGGEKVVLLDPSSPLYSLALRQRRARICWLPARAEAGRLRFRQDELARAMAGARLMAINVPVNPTGAGLAPEDIEEIAWWADRHDVLIFCDQAFDRFQYEGRSLCIGTLVKAQRRTLTAGSVSKGHALAALRVGWLAGHRHLVRPCAVTALLHTPFVPTLCQQIAVTALQQPDELFAPIHADFDSRRRYAYERLQAMGLAPIWPAGGFFFWVPVGELGFTGRSFAQQLRAEHKVLVLPGEFFGPSGSGFIRLSYAAEEGRLREGLSRMADFLRRSSQSGSRPTKKAA